MRDQVHAPNRHDDLGANIAGTLFLAPNGKRADHPLMPGVIQTTSYGPISFAEALQRTASRPRYLLLGNGFSIGVHSAFGYASLYDDAVHRDPSLRPLFLAENPNFEVALQRCLTPDDEARLKKGLIRAVAAVHPEHSLSLTEEQCISCRNFLEHFVGRNRSPAGVVFTTNYDMLLHWVLSRQGKNAGTKQRSQIKCWDGFKANGEWSVGDAQAYYLHGAVHIYEFPEHRFPERTYTKMLRYEWGRPLLRQVDSLLRDGRFPIFIAEGDSQRKQARQRGEYLRAARLKYRNVCRNPAVTLFSFGHSFGPSDDHIADHIGNGALRDVFLGTFSDEDRHRTEALWSRWNEQRRALGAPGVNVYWFDSAECEVWTAQERAA